MTTCNQLLDHSTYPERVRACSLPKGHRRPHKPGPWRSPTKGELKRMGRAEESSFSFRGNP